MPNMMESMASGSTAARQMQQNVYGAQYDQQNIAADAQKKQLDLQKEQAQIQETQANTAQTKLSTIVTESKVKVDEQFKKDVSKLQGDPTWASKSIVEQTMAMAALVMPTDPAKGAQLANAAASFELKEVQTELKKADAASRAIGTAYSNIKDAGLEKTKALTDDTTWTGPSQFEKTLNDLPEDTKAAIKKSSPGFFEMNDPKVQKSILENLMLTGSGQALQMKIQGNIQLEQMREANRVAIKQMEINAAENRRAAGAGERYSKQDLAAFNSYSREARRIEFDNKKNKEDADKEVKDAEKNVAPSRLLGFNVPFTGNEKAYTEAVKRRDELGLKIAEEKLKIARSLPDHVDTSNIERKLEEEISTYQKPKDIPSGTEAQSTAPSAPSKAPATAGAGAPTAPAAVTSTKANTAPPEALAMLAKDPSEKNKKFFKETFGYLPPETNKTSSETKPVAATTLPRSLKELTPAQKSEAASTVAAQKKASDAEYEKNKAKRKTEEEAFVAKEKADKEKADKQWEEQQKAITESKKRGPAGYSSNDVDPLTGLVRQKTFTQYPTSYLEKIANGSNRPGMITKEEAEEELKRRTAANRLK